MARKKKTPDCTYEIQVCFGTRDLSFPQEATTDDQAVRLVEGFVKKLVVSDGEACTVFLAFFRRKDGQRGYINRDGAHAVGKSWN